MQDSLSYRGLVLFFFNETAPTEIYTLSLHDALPISRALPELGEVDTSLTARLKSPRKIARSEEHTSELQSRLHLGCRLLLEKSVAEGSMSKMRREHGSGTWLRRPAVTA